MKKSLEGFARQDLPLFREWLTRQPEGALRQQVLNEIMPRWVVEDFPSALAAVQAMSRAESGPNLRFWSLLNNVVKGGSAPLSWEEQDRRMAMLAPEDRAALDGYPAARNTGAGAPGHHAGLGQERCAGCPELFGP